MKILNLFDVFSLRCRVQTIYVKQHKVTFLKKSQKSIYLQQTYGFGYYMFKSIIYLESYIEIFQSYMFKFTF